MFETAVIGSDLAQLQGIRPLFSGGVMLTCASNCAALDRQGGSLSRRYSHHRGGPDVSIQVTS